MKLSNEALQGALERHAKFLSGDPDGEMANLNHAELYGVNLVGVNLKGANLEGADLKRSLLCQGNFEGANMKEVSLKRAILEGANFYQANLEFANLKGANLNQCNLKCANLTNADCEDSTFIGAEFDKNTIWPEGLDPELIGAKRIDELSESPLVSW